jgi:hypothetical protein
LHRAKPGRSLVINKINDVFLQLPIWFTRNFKSNFTKLFTEAERKVNIRPVNASRAAEKWHAHSTLVFRSMQTPQRARSGSWRYYFSSDYFSFDDSNSETGLGFVNYIWHPCFLLYSMFLLVYSVSVSYWLKYQI